LDLLPGAGRTLTGAPAVFGGTGMVVASAAMAAHPLVLLPILFYNLMQHVVAGVMDFLLFRDSPRRRTQRLPQKLAA
jgi:hypothetical protein